MKAKRSFNPAVKVIIVGIGVISCLALAWIFWFMKSVGESPYVETAFIYQPAPTPGGDLDVIEADAEIKIPSSAREIHAMISGAQEVEAWVRLDLPIEELAEFLRNSQCYTPLTPIDLAKITIYELDPEWWRPNEARQLEKCTGGHAYLYQQIWVDRTNPEIATIYVFSATADFTNFTPEP